MRAYERLLRYAAVDTQSDEHAERTPSTEKQYAFAWLLRNEMKDLGMKRVFTDPRAYTYGFLPPSPEMKAEPMIGLIAHIDTAPDFSGAGVRPKLVKNYDGRDLPLGKSGLVLRPADFPDLRGTFPSARAALSCGLRISPISKSISARPSSSRTAKPCSARTTRRAWPRS